MTRRLLLTLATLAALYGAPVAAQMACGTHDSITTQLSNKYGEARRGRGLSSPTAVFEIWTSNTTGTWTIIKTTPNGQTCIVAIGHSWQTDIPHPKGDPI